MSPPGLSPRDSEPTDDELIERLRRDDTGALDIVLRRYWASLVAYLLRLLGTRDTAEDVAQRAFLRIWDRRHEWQLAGSLRGLLFRVAHNLAISEQRSETARHRSAAAFAERAIANPTPHDVLAGDELRGALSRAIEALPERRREVFVLRCIHDLSYKEIAEVMDISPQTVANQLSQALATLRRTLEPVLDRELG